MELPEEVLLKVFSNLGPEDLILASQVSKTWSRVAGDYTMWRQVTLTVQKFPNTTNIESHINKVIGRESSHVISILWLANNKLKLSLHCQLI